MKYEHKQNLHTHTTFCDGHNSVEEMVLKAIELNFNSIGFSGHSPDYLASYCMSYEDIDNYVKEVNFVKEKYKNKIKVFLGLEYDYYSECDETPYDYIIGSVHYLNTNLGMQEADTRDPVYLRWLIDNCYGGNPINLVKFYFNLVKELPNKIKNISIIAHLDILLKSHEISPVFDTNSTEYREIVLDCVQHLINKGIIFEVNTGAIARGVRTEVYPQKWVLEEICKRGGKVTISSDCHYAEKLNFYFEEAVKTCKECGFNKIYTFNGKEFVANDI